MSFVVVAALAVGLLVAIPLAAHYLRRGRARSQEFPPASLVPRRPPIARHMNRLEDRFLLLVRLLMVAALAMLGATPLVRCSRLSLGRDAGASVALALVVDDSLSMRATTGDGKSRWALAQAGARELLRSAREGDAVAIVLAGRPARLALAATTDLDAARRAVGELRVSDRATDLAGAVQLARSSLRQLPQVDKRVVLLSDLADVAAPEGEPPSWAPLAGLRQPMVNCGVVQAEQRGRRVDATVACASAGSARNRRLEVVVDSPQQNSTAAREAEPNEVPEAGRVLIAESLAVRGGAQTVTVEVGTPAADLSVRLTGTDAIAQDDVAPVAPEDSASSIAVVVDRAAASVTTGGMTTVEQALLALQSAASVRPLTLLPDDLRELKAYAAVVLDDPPGLPAEARAALSQWMERGGVALALLGPRVQAVQLGSTLEPFVGGAVRWEDQPGSDRIDLGSLSWLGSEAGSLTDLGARGRAELSGATMAGTRVLARWSDGNPWLLERTVGRGVALTAGLPASVDLSDFALRPGFVALLDHVMALATDRAGPLRSVAGSVWSFPVGVEAKIEGPKGAVEIRETGPGATRPDAVDAAQRIATVELAGRYQVRLGDESQVRIVTLDPQEVSRQPEKLDAKAQEQEAAIGRSQVDASAELAVLLLLLLAAELVMRLVLRTRRQASAGA